MTEGLKSKDIIAIIKACGQSQVKEFSFGGLQLSFAAKEEEVPQVIQFHSVDEPHKPHPDEFKADEERIKTRQLEDMLLENPLMYEQLLAQGELEDGQDARHQ
jgi:hypothetical protein